MVSIYKITNDVNDIVYVGKTRRTLKVRFRDHLGAVNNPRYLHNKFYTAMREIGIRHFSITQIEECEDDVGSKREIYWIDKYKNTCGVYNETLGGDGMLYYDHEEILKALEENPCFNQVAKKIGCSSHVVRRVGRKNGMKGMKRIAVDQYDMDGRLLRRFSSMTEAVLWCYNNGHIKSPKGAGVSYISRAARGKVKTAFGYQWRYANSD